MNSKLDSYLVQKYPKIFVDRYGDTKETSMCWGFQNNDGWFWLIDQLCESIQSYTDNNNSYRKDNDKIKQVVATSVKEKFGILSFDYYNGDNLIEGMVWLAEHMSMNICEFCGSTHNVGRTTGWVYTICKECYSNSTEDRIINLPWKENVSESIDYSKELRKIKIDKINQSE